ncbi:MAG: KH domain-containing protein [Calditrichaeota bacterium]|nr:KH domain-containing protein [Calditrichota bacterium]
MLKEFLENIVKPLVDKPDEVKITEIEGKTVSIYELRVNSGDYGKVIGKHGQNANAIRTIFGAVAAKVGKRGVLEILE